MGVPSVIVVGAGALGLATAWQLRQSGVLQITVIDAEYPASGSSGLSVGYLQTQHLTPFNIEIRAVAMRTFDELARDHGLEIKRNGYLRLGFTADQVRTFERSVEIQREFGITHPRILDPDALHLLVPDMRVDDVAGALLGPEDGYLDGHLYCQLLAEMLTDRGVAILPKTPIHDAEELSDGRVRISTPRGDFEAEYAVNAAGAWAGRVAGLLGTTVSIRPERHQAVIARLPHPLAYAMPCVMAYSPGSGTPGLFFRHERHAHLVVGMHSLEPVGEVVDPDNYRRSNDLEFLEEVAERFQQRLPALEEAQLGGGWAGTYPMSDDGLPVVGPSPGRPNIIQANGAGGAGIMLSPVIGRVAAEWILDGKVRCISDPEALAPARLVASTPPEHA